MPYGDTKTAKDRLTKKAKATGIFGRRASMSKALEEKKPKGAEKEIEREEKEIRCEGCGKKNSNCVCK